MTRKDHLVLLTTGLLNTPRYGQPCDHVAWAKELLTEIEKVCPDAVSVTASAVYTYDAIEELMAKERADERERCAKIAEALELKDYEDVWIRSAIVSNIRRGGA